MLTGGMILGPSNTIHLNGHDFVAGVVVEHAPLSRFRDI